MAEEVLPRIISVNVSEETGTRKCDVGSCMAVVEHGLEGDAHAGEWHRQISLLATESIDKMRLKGLDVWPGDFAENLTTQGIELPTLPVGTTLRIGGRVLLEVTQIGKVCVERCAIYYQAGDCVMPREGIFVRVLEGGAIGVGDTIVVEKRGPEPAPGEEQAAPEQEAPLRAAVVTVSDKGFAGEREDASGAVVKEMLEQAGITVGHAEIVPDDVDMLAALLRRLCGERFNLVVTTGGTGLSPRDVTPEATLSVIEKEVPGMAEAMRAESLKVTPHAMLSRAVCGLLGGTLIVNLPGSPKGARECLQVVMPAVPHAMEVAAGNVSECAAPPAEPRG